MSKFRKFWRQLWWYFHLTHSSIFGVKSLVCPSANFIYLFLQLWFLHGGYTLALPSEASKLKESGLFKFNWKYTGGFHLIIINLVFKSRPNVIVSGNIASIARQFLRCTMFNLAPNGLFTQLFQTPLPGESYKYLRTEKLFYLFLVRID